MSTYRGDPNALTMGDALRDPATARRYAQQIDLDGQLHDLAPQTRQEKLFIPAPAQLPGQEVMPELS